MKEKEKESIHLVVIDDSSNGAEAVSNMLRNSGRAVRTTRIEAGEDLREALNDRTWDMILTRPEVPFLSAADVVAVVRDAQMDIPVILLTRDGTPEKVAAALRAGVRDAVALTEPERVQHVLLRELGDLTERRRRRACEQLLEEATLRAQALVDSSRDAIAYVHEGMHLYANASYLRLFGYDAFPQMDGVLLMDMVSATDQPKLKEALRRREQAVSTGVTALKNDGTSSQVTMEFSPISFEGESCIQILIRDQSMSQELVQKLESINKRDRLTGLCNRAHFLETLQQVVGDGQNRGALLYLEPERFREVREQIGIVHGDAVIAELAQVLSQSIGDKDLLLARLGGSAFALLATGAAADQVETLAGELIKSVSEHVFRVAERSLTSPCSVGISFFDESITSAEDVLARADKAQRQAVEGGGNAFRTYTPASNEMGEKERSAVWGKKLVAALREGAFYLLYQPIVSLQGDASENYEVFVRLQDDGNEIDPLESLSAEQAALMVAIDRWTLHSSVRQLIERRKMGKPTRLFVNLSETSIKDANLLPWLTELLKAARVEGSELVIEIAEAVVQANLMDVKALLEGLRSLKVRSAVNQFGMATGSAHLLRHIQPNYIKLHGSFMTDFARSPEQRQKVKELATTIKGANCHTMAEFVEDANTLAALWGCGVDYIQGYFLQRPARELNYDFASGAGGGG